MNRFTMILQWTYVLLVVPSSFAALHPISPCPSIFSYEGAQPENERWYGQVLLSTDESLVGVRLDIKLDRPAEILVSWMGTVTTDDNERFTILSLDQKLHPGPPFASRFMVKFNSVKGSPKLRTIRLNGKQICPPDPNFATDIQHNNQDHHLYDNRYTTERITKRPDLDFDSDWTRPLTPPRTPSTVDAYKPPKQPNSGYSSHEVNSGHSSHETSNSGGHNSHIDKNSGNHNKHVNREPVRTSTYGYDSHETYQIDKNRRPSTSSSSYNHSRPSNGNQGQQGFQDNLRPLVTENTDYGRPSISININKDVTLNVDRPDTLNYSGDNVKEPGGSRPSVPREPSYNTNQHQKTTERYNEYGNSGIRDETYGKTTTKKPVVINSININIHSVENEDNNEGPIYNQAKPTMKIPVRNNTASHQTNHRPSSAENHQTSSNNNGYQGSRPHRNPETASSETHYQSGYGQSGYSSNDKTTEKKKHENNQGANNQLHNNQGASNQHHKPTNTDQRPSPVPSSRPSGGGGNKNIPRPQTSGQKYGEDGDLQLTNSNVKCGRVEINPAPLITHGQSTARGQWPWHIALYRIEGINLSYSCGGSLVSSTVVITAAHCVTKPPRDRPVDADILVVQLGKYHLYQFSDDSVQNKQVQRVHVHPRYNSTNYLDDLAILILSSPAEFTKYVRPVCLWPRHNFNLPNLDNKEGTVVGWGYDENNQVTEELKMARMPVVSYVTCLKSYPQFFSQFTAENKTFCAGFRKGTSVCNGDSGGGMVFQQDNVWYLRGLVSITVAKQGLRVCDTNHYVVFTDLSNYIDWINQFMS